MAEINTIPAGVCKGDDVYIRVKPELGCAKVDLLYVTVEGGVRLDRELDGCISWNISELVVVSPVVRRVAAALAEYPGDPATFPYERLSATARSIVNDTIRAFHERSRLEEAAELVNADGA